MVKKTPPWGPNPMQERRDARVLKMLPLWMSPIAPPEPDLAPISIVRPPPQSTIDSMVLLRSRKGIGRYLTKSQVVLVNDESDRPAAIAALEAADFRVQHPLGETPPGALIFNAAVSPAGGWGNVIIFDAEAESYDRPIRTAVIDLDVPEIFCVSPHLVAPIQARLERMGVHARHTWPPSPTQGFNDKLPWDSELWEGPPLDRKLYWFPEDTPRRLNCEVANELPPEVATAFDAQMQKPAYNPLNRRQGAFWERQNGVLNPVDLTKLRDRVPRSVRLPEGWEQAWEDSVNLSAPHAPALCALALQKAFPEWWDSLPLLDRVTDTWLLGHSHAEPKWLKYDPTDDSERRFNSAVALVVAAAADLTWMLTESRKKIHCKLCGFEFERGMLQAGEIYQMESAHICNLCRQIGWPTSAKQMTPLEEAGLLAQIAALADLAGGVISASMTYEMSRPPHLSPEAWYVLSRPLPPFVTMAWTDWLRKSGTLGETWRHSRGVNSVASDGHPCKSMLERVVDDFFAASGIAHEIEPPYPFDAALNPHGSLADWKLADGTFVEAAGLMTSPDYAAKMERKRLLADAHGIDLIIVTESSLVDLTNIFARYISASSRRLKS